MKHLKFVFCLLILTAVVTSCSSPSTTQNQEEIFFLQDIGNTGIGGDTAALEGQLSLTGGCFLVTDQYGTKYSPVWPNGYSYKNTTAAIEIYNDAGKTIARIGEPVNLVGGEFSALDYENLDDLLSGPLVCPKPLWSVNGASPL